MRTRLLLALLGCLVLKASSSPEVSDQLAGSEEVVPIDFMLVRVGSIEILSIQRDGSMYLPAIEVFSFLRVKNEYDTTMQRLTGFFVTADTPFVIDARALTAVVGKRAFTLRPDEFVLREGLLYLRTDVFLKFFGLDIRYDPRQLRARLETRLELPAFLDRRLARQEEALAARPERIRPQAMFTTKVDLLDGARVDWNIFQSISERGLPRRSFSTRLTGHVLGGDAEMRFAGRLSPITKLDVSRVRWNYIVSSEEAVRRISVGDLTTSGLLMRSVVGVEVTNRPAYQRLLFGRELLLGHMEPERKLYVYRGAALSSVFNLPETGQYRVEIPLRYGTNLYSLRSYSVWGELREEDYRLLVPSSMVPPGEVDYSLTAGRLRMNGWPWYWDVSGRWGISSKVTLGARMEQYRFERTADRVFPTGILVVRMADHAVAEGIFSPQAFMRGTVSVMLPTLVGGSFSFTKFEDFPLLNPRGALHEASINSTIPFFIDKGRFVINAAAVQTLFPGRRERTGSVGVAALLGAVNPGLSTSASWVRVSGEPTQTLFWESDLSVRIPLPANLVFGASTRYDHLAGRFPEFRAEALARPIRNLSMEISYTRSFIFKQTYVALRLEYLLAFTRATAFIRRNPVGFESSQSLSGSFGYSPEPSNFFFDYNPTRAGFGGIFVVPFIDANNNGVRDLNEELIGEGRLRVFTGDGDGATLMTLVPDVGWAVMNALPYQPYHVEFDTRGFANPLWIPRYTAFSVSVPPGRYLYVGVPVITGGTVRGAVRLLNRGIGGVTVHIREIVPAGQLNERTPFEQSVKTFSTGDYEFTVVPPGRYEVAIDALEVEQLGFSAQPLSHTVTVESKPDLGDLVDRVDFILKPRINR